MGNGRRSSDLVHLLASGGIRMAERTLFNRSGEEVGAGPQLEHDAAQRLRLRRMLMGMLTYAGSTALVCIAYLLDFLAAPHLGVFLLAVLFLNLGFVTAIVSGFNLRLKDPSMTGAQVLLAAVPVLYVMYHLEAAQVRMAFLQLGVVTMLFAVMRFEFRGTLIISAILLLSYLGLLVALWQLAPGLMNPRAEAMVLAAYAITLGLVCYLGDYITGLRRRLQQRNLDLKEALGRLHELATRDALTQLPNRRTIMELMNREASRTGRRQPGDKALCLCMMDIDYFKQVNDRHGHQVGDTVLRKVADALQQSIRTEDVVARFGGEEFLLMLPESNLAGARQAVERLRQALAALPLDEIGDLAPITVSIGVAVHRPGEHLDTTISRADTALYQAKGQGRDRVVISD